MGCRGFLGEPHAFLWGELSIPSALLLFAARILLDERMCLPCGGKQWFICEVVFGFPCVSPVDHDRVAAGSGAIFTASQGEHCSWPVSQLCIQRQMAFEDWVWCPADFPLPLLAHISAELYVKDGIPLTVQQVCHGCGHVSER